MRSKREKREEGKGEKKEFSGEGLFAESPSPDPSSKKPNYWVVTSLMCGYQHLASFRGSCPGMRVVRALPGQVSSGPGAKVPNSLLVAAGVPAGPMLGRQLLLSFLYPRALNPLKLLNAGQHQNCSGW
jgi:hypothetical protein